MNIKLTIDNYRKKLAGVDAEIIALLKKRNKLSSNIAQLKFVENIKIKQPEKWKSDTRIRAARIKKLGLSKKSTEAIFEEIHKESIKVQKKVFRKLKKNEK